VQRFASLSLRESQRSFAPLAMTAKAGPIPVCQSQSANPSLPIPVFGGFTRLPASHPLTNDAVFA
jgi:hypothetical protein